MNIAYNEDCMKVMSRFPDKFFDLAVVDPPYGIGESGGKNKSRSNLAKSRDYKDYAGHDADPPPPEFFVELRRVSQHQIIFGANHFISRMGVQIDSPCWIVWDKENGDSDFADCELAWCSFRSAVRIFRFRWHGMIQGNMRNKEVRIHPNQKPVALYEWIFYNYTKPGFKILDTHLGSGSSRIAAYNAGLDFVGCDIDKYYFGLEEERFVAHTQQIRIGELWGPTDCD